MLSSYGNCTLLLKNKNKLKIACFLQIKPGGILQILWAFSIIKKKVIPPALVGYEMITANEVRSASLATTISYPTNTRGIIVKKTECYKQAVNTCHTERRILGCLNN